MPAWILFAILCLCPWRSAAEVSTVERTHYINLDASVGYHYSTGSYGDPQKTQIVYVPLIVRGDFDAWSLELTLPYLYIRGPRGILGVVEGDPDDGSDDIERGSGPGDILLSAGYTFWPFAKWMPFLSAIGRIKFPTASENEGLGTGEFDYYAGGQAVWSVGPFVPFIEAGYEALGDSADVGLRDAGRVSGGSSYLVAEPLYIGLSFDYGSPTSSSAGERIDLVPFISWDITGSMNLAAYGSAGLASGSPDIGVGIQLTYRVYDSERQ